MTVRDLCSAGIEIQGNPIYCYYDDAAEQRANITEEEAADLEIKYIYCENNTLYIEVEK